MYISTYMYTNIRIHTSIHIRIHTYIEQVCIHAYKRYTYTNICVLKFIGIHKHPYLGLYNIHMSGTIIHISGIKTHVPT